MTEQEYKGILCQAFILAFVFHVDLHDDKIELETQFVPVS